MEKLNYKIKNIERKYFKDMQKTISKGKEYSFRIRKRFYRIARKRIKRMRSKNYKRDRRTIV